MAGSGFAHDVAGGNGTLVADALKSPNFVHGISGWSIGKDGSAEFHDIIIPAGSGGTVVTFAATAPAGPNTGDVWYDTANGLQPSVWTGTAWAPYSIGTGAIAAGAITTGLVDFTARDIGAVNVTYSAAAPPSPNEGDIWIQVS